MIGNRIIMDEIKRSRDKVAKMGVANRSAEISVSTKIGKVRPKVAILNFLGSKKDIKTVKTNKIETTKYKE